MIKFPRSGIEFADRQAALARVPCTSAGCKRTVLVGVPLGICSQHMSHLLISVHNDELKEQIDELEQTRNQLRGQRGKPRLGFLRIVLWRFPWERRTQEDTERYHTTPSTKSNSIRAFAKRLKEVNLKKILTLVAIVLMVASLSMAQVTQTVACTALIAGGCTINITPLTANWSVLWTTVGFRDSLAGDNLVTCTWSYTGAARAKIILSCPTDWTPVIAGQTPATMLACEPAAGFSTTGTVVSGAFPIVGAAGKTIWTSTDATGSFTAGVMKLRFQTFTTVPPNTYLINAVFTIASTI